MLCPTNFGGFGPGREVEALTSAVQRAEGFTRGLLRKVGVAP
jgi:hypothetical protein